MCGVKIERQIRICFHIIESVVRMARGDLSGVKVAHIIAVAHMIPMFHFYSIAHTFETEN